MWIQICCLHPGHIIIPNPLERSFPSPSNIPANVLIRQKKCWCRSLCAVSVPSFFIFYFRHFFLLSAGKKEATSSSSGSSPHFLNHTLLSAFPPCSRCVIVPSDTRTHPRWDVRNRDPSSPLLFAGGGVTFYSWVFVLHSPHVCLFSQNESN